MIFAIVGPGPSPASIWSPASIALCLARGASLRAERLRPASDGAARGWLHCRRPQQLRRAPGFEARGRLAQSVALRLELRRAGRVQSADAGSERNVSTTMRRLGW